MVRLAFALVALLAASPAFAQQQDEPERCPRLVADAAPPMPLVRVAFKDFAQAKSGEVRLTFVGHATFLIESPAGVTIATDYNGEVKPKVIPLIATMNRAHPTHYTLTPEPEIKYVLHGWGENGKPVDHRLTVQDVWIRNVTTNIRYELGGGRDQNSMFVFEVAGLCIAHLGHLHHKLTPEHLKALGRIDVVLTPVDRGLTLNIEQMIDVLKSIAAPVVVPMHYFNQGSLEMFLTQLSNTYAIDRRQVPVLTVSRDSLPKRQTVVVLPGF